MSIANSDQSVSVKETVAGSSEIIVTDLQALTEHNLDAYKCDAQGAFSAATERALRSDSLVFGTWCSSRALSALPAEPSTVAAFIDDQALTKKPATIRRYVSSISHMHRAADVPNPCERSQVKLALKRLGKTLPAEQRQAEGITRRLVDVMMHASGDSVRDIRNRAMLAVAYDTLARRSELVSLQVADIHKHPKGDGSIKIFRSKTDQSGEGSIRYLAPDTMRLVEEWISRAGITDGELFRTVFRSGRIGGGLSAYDVTRTYKEMATTAGLPLETVEAISSHSTRFGASQDMAASDRIEMPAIMQAGGWKSPTMVARYTKQQSARRSGSAKLAELQNRTS